MQTPYDGLEESDLLELKSFYLKVLTGKLLMASNIPGLSWTKRVPSMEEARVELVLVNAALDNISGDPQFTDRTFMKAT